VKAALPWLGFALVLVMLIVFGAVLVVGEVGKAVLFLLRQGRPWHQRQISGMEAAK
jgi:hypothetical protein